jgi:hypothetical protein
MYSIHWVDRVVLQLCSGTHKERLRASAMFRHPRGAVLLWDTHLPRSSLKMSDLARPLRP